LAKKRAGARFKKKKEEWFEADELDLCLELERIGCREGKYILCQQAEEI